HHFDPSRRLALHEHIVQNALLIHPLGVGHRVSAAEGAKSAGIELAELRLFERRLTQQLRLAVGLRYLHEHQPAQPQGDDGGEAEQGREQPRRPETTGLQRGHLAVVVHAARVSTTASNRPTGTMTDKFMIAPRAIKSNTTRRPY